jgi:hypothetical protein
MSALECTPMFMLGLMVMWVVFDQIWAKSAVRQMIDVFTENLRLMRRPEWTA